MTDEPVYVVFHAETVFCITDRSSLQKAAEEAIARRDYGSDLAAQPERDADVAAARAETLEALLTVADPALAVPDDFGVQEIRSTFSAQLSDERGRVPQARPDFAVLFAEDESTGWQLTPRTAALLWAAAQTRADAAFDDVENYGDEPVTEQANWSIFDEYPRVTHHQNAVWRRQAARAFDDLAADLSAGTWPAPRCVAEEMALRLILEWCEALEADLPEFVEEVVSGLPVSRDDFDWRVAFEALLQDDDLADLFEAALDGVEDPEDERNHFMGMGDYRPSAWFNTFGTASPRDGRRPFRR